MGGLQHAEAGESRAMSSHPTLSAPWWSRLTFHWANPLMADGFRKHRAAEKAAKGGEAGQVDTLSPEDIWPLPPDQQARSVASRFIKEWEKELAETGGIDGGNGQVGAALGALAGLEMELDSTIVGITKSNLPGADVDGNGKNAAGEKDGIKVEDSGSGTGSQAKKSPSLFRAVWRTYRKQFYVAALLRILADGCAIGTPLVLRQFVIFLSNSASSFAAGQPLPEAWRGYLMAFGLGAMLLIQTFAMALTWMLSQKIGFEIKTALMSYTYQKLLRLSAGARLTFTGGNIINLVSTDATRIDRALPEMHTLYSAPITIIIGLALLITNLGWPALVGGAVLVFVMIPFTGKIMSVAAKLREKGTKWTDLRVKVTNEAVSGIRVVKFLGWTKPIVSNIADNIRATEMKYVRGILFYRVFVGLISMSGPILASIAMFLSFSAAGGTLTPAVVLSSIALLELIRWPLLLLPMSLSWTVDAWVSLGRFSALFLAPEVDASESRGSENGVDGVVVEEGTVLEWDAVPSVESEEDLRKQKEAARKGFVWRTLGRTKKGKSKETEMAMEEAVKTVPEDKEGESPVAAGESFGASGGTFSVVLKQLQMKPGTLTTVVGPVGSGKSTLLAGLIGDVKVVRGGVKASGTVAYCAQTPWIQSASIRDNILFGLPYDEKRFVEVIRVCGLERDLSIFTDGDFTAVGEKGLSLSGGQKARLALARAIYQDAAIYILDDILSALDSHTGAFVYENCIRGFLRPKTVVLATHALHVLSSSDQIICLRKGKIVEMGTYKDLVGAEESEVEGAGYLARMVKEYGMAKESEEEEEEQVGSEASGSTAEVEVEVEGAVVVGNLQGIKDNKQAVGITTKDAARKQFQDEEKFQGAVTFAVWRKYFKAMGGAGMIFSILSTLIAMQGSRIVTDWWVSTVWAKGAYGLSTGAYEGVYVGLGLAQVLFVLINGLLVATGGSRSAHKIHNDALRRVFNAPVRFFDSTPTGRIMNRFSKDVESMDSFVPDVLRFFIRMVGQAVSTLIFIVAVTPIFLAPLVPLAILYIMISTFYRATAREIKRMEAVSRSPLYALYGETLAGLATIRAFRKADVFLRLSEARLDENNKYWHIMLYTVRWLSVRLESIASGMVFLSAAFAVLAAQSSPSSAGLLGLAVTNALQIVFLLNYVVELGSEIETHMISAERLLDYAEELPQEPATGKAPPPEWPSAGAIRFDNLDMRYAPDLPLVIKNVTFDVAPGERVGIVGRTGAGKSSITNALFRLVEPCGGKVFIDGIDHSTLPLDDLRNKLSIITQDPVLFSGTLRFNMDMFHQYSDEDIMEVLAHAGNVKDLVLNHPDGLNMPISEDGQSLSSGQRQLVCLARTMLRRAKVVVLDEATASVDADADNQIQKTLREDERFKGTTILTIAHRLLTIIDYDKVLVLAHGEMVEFGSPAELLAKPDGMFRSMVDNTGPEQAQVLIEMANKAAADRKNR